MTIVSEPLTFKYNSKLKTTPCLGGCCLWWWRQLLVRLRWWAGMETKAETSSGQSRSVGPVAGRSHWAGVWQAVADLPPLGAGASNSESESLWVSVQCQGPGSEVCRHAALCLRLDNYSYPALNWKVRQHLIIEIWMALVIQTSLYILHWVIGRI